MFIHTNAYNPSIMCGRYSFAPDLKIVNEHYDITADPEAAAPNYNCAPTQLLPVISNETPQKLEKYRWGLIPFWAKDAAIGNRMINARAETLAEKPAFRSAFRKRRCLIPADAFYEWFRPSQGKRKIPYRIFLRNQQVFSIAGIWESWKDAEAREIRSFSIITTEPNQMMKEIHNRMPVIIPKNAEETWLYSDTKTELLSLLKPYPSDEMNAYRISDLVNSPRNNSPLIIEPVDQ